MSQSIVQLSKTINTHEKNIKGADIRDIEIYHECLEKPEFKQSKTKEKIIDDDEYLAYLERIVSRDYYPNAKTDNKSFLGLDNDIIPINMNVDSFLINFASDELESIKDIISKDNLKKLRKRLWMYKEEVKYKKMNRNELLGKDNQYGSIIAKNPLFFVPLNREESKLLGRKRDSENCESIVNDDDFEKKIMNENTRFPNNFVEKMEQEHNSKVHKRLIEMYENSDIIRLIKEMKEDKVINGHSLIHDNKTNDNNKRNDNPKQMPLVFTWGEIASTPIAIKETGNQFKVPETPQRDAIAYDLLNKINSTNLVLKSKATKAREANQSNQSSLTPGGLKLLNSIKRNNLLFNNNNKDNSSKLNNQIPTPQRRLSSIRIKKKTED